MQDHTTQLKFKLGAPGGDGAPVGSSPLATDRNYQLSVPGITIVGLSMRESRTGHRPETAQPVEASRFHA